jgi:hypothetical protein
VSVPVRKTEFYKAMVLARGLVLHSVVFNDAVKLEQLIDTDKNFDLGLCVGKQKTTLSRKNNWSIICSNESL